jgi:hypothetical protein
MSIFSLKNPLWASKFNFRWTNIGKQRWHPATQQTMPNFTSFQWRYESLYWWLKKNKSKMWSENIIGAATREQWAGGGGGYTGSGAQSILGQLCLSKTQKNEEYELDSLKSIQSSVSRYWMEKNGAKILQDCWKFVKIIINMTYMVCNINLLNFKM